MTENAWKEAADQLIFIENDKLKKLRHLPLTPVKIFLSGSSRNLKCYFVLSVKSKVSLRKCEEKLC